MQQEQMAQVFDEWNKGELDSFLIEITRDILKFKGSDGECLKYSLNNFVLNSRSHNTTIWSAGKFLLPKILDTAGQKGTGKWTGISALEYGVPVTLIGEAVFARCLSALKGRFFD